MSSAENPQFVSVQDYLGMEAGSQAKHEYVDGWVRAMTGASVRHNDISINCLCWLRAVLGSSPCRPYHSDMKLRIDRKAEHRFYYPDVQVVCDAKRPTAVFQDRPVLIIEVISPATRRYDLDEKLNAYLQIQTLQCYLVLEQHQPIAITLRRTEAGFLREYHEGIDSIIDLDFLGCTMPLREVYQGIEFTAECVQEEDPEYASIQASVPQ